MCKLRVLTLEAQERIDLFEAKYSDASCGCSHPNAYPPCWFCTHEDAPHNVYEDDASYETIEVMETCIEPSMEDALRYEHSKTKGQGSTEREDGIETLARLLVQEAPVVYTPPWHDLFLKYKKKYPHQDERKLAKEAKEVYYRIAYYEKNNGRYIPKT